MILVGTRKYTLNRMLMSHMVSDDTTAEGIAELHAFAERLGVSRKHFQDGKRPHYDICQAKKKDAITLGAKLVNDRKIVALFENSTYSDIKQ